MHNAGRLPTGSRPNLSSLPATVPTYCYINQTGTAYTNTYTTTLAKFEGYKESTVQGTSTLLQPGTTTDSYDVDGNLVAVTDSTQPANNRTFVNDVMGHVLMRNQAGNEQFLVFANGQQVGTTGFGINARTTWALVFAKRYQARYGFDAGIEQEAFKVLERAPADVDWQVVERLNQTAQA